MAEWLDPTPLTPVDRLMPLARAIMLLHEPMQVGGSIKWLLAMKFMERQTGARRRHINAAIDRAVLERDGD